MFLTRDQILGSALPVEAVECPEWGGTVHVRTVPVGERLKLEAAIEANKEHPYPCVVLAFALCEEDGTPLFKEADIPLLAKQDPRPLVRAAEVAARLNAIKSAEVDELEKNS